MTRRSIILLVFACSLSSLLRADELPQLNPKDKLIVETILRLKDFDINSSAPAKAALLRYLRAKKGTQQYFELIERFQLTDVAEELVQFAIEHSDETGGVRAAELLFKMDQQELLTKLATSSVDDQAVAAATLIGHVAGAKTVEMLGPLVTDLSLSPTLRSLAVKAIGRRADGQRYLLNLVVNAKLPKDLHFAAANVLLSSDNEEIRSKASQHLQLPATADSKPLPSLQELTKRQGDVESGAIVFRKAGTCIKCHKVLGEGKEVGPDLSEIGSKLSREAMYVSILDPSAAVSHNYESYSLITLDGDAVAGLLISETDDAVTLRTAEGIDKTVSQEDVDLLKKQTESLMPQDLQRLMTGDQLVDLVEYLLTLKKN